MCWSIEELIEKRRIEVFGFLIISPYTNKTNGIEAVCKGIHPDGKEYISFKSMMEKAIIAKRETELQFLCLDMTIDKFAQTLDQDDKIILFINIGEEMIDGLLDDMDYIVKRTNQHGIRAERIVLEFNIFHFTYLQKVIKLVNHFRKQGFFISLDSMGEGYFNLDKIVAIRPDIIKLQHNFLDKIENENYKSYIGSYLIDICNRMGVLIVTIGIERIEDFYSALDSGSQFVEGFYINEPMVFNRENIEASMRIINNDEKVEEYLVSRVKEGGKKTLAEAIFKYNDIIKEFTDHGSKNFHISIADIFNQNDHIEGIYFLNEKGIQTSHYYRRSCNLNEFYNQIVQEYLIGSDHSQSSEYTNLIQYRLSIWVTLPYISPFSNNHCVTVSSFITNEKDEKEILCIAFKMSE